MIIGFEAPNNSDVALEETMKPLLKKISLQSSFVLEK
jgi:hypothetical protein